MEPRLVILQPTPFCNLDCSYCYLPFRDNRKCMSEETLVAIGRNVLSTLTGKDPVAVVWHAGEPMTLPPGWYQAAFSILRDAAPDANIQHCFQTNGIGINEAWIRLWREWRVSVGISIDGPSDVHDSVRKTRGGKGSYHLTLKGIERLKEAGFPFHILTVLGAPALSDPDRMFSFYREQQLAQVCFNIEEEEGAHRVSGLRAIDFELSYARFLKRFIELQEETDFRIHCREIFGVLELAAIPAEFRRRNTMIKPLEILSISVDGGMSTFSPELLGVPDSDFDNFVFADVHYQKPEAIQQNPSFQRLYAEILSGVSACEKSCAYFEVCGGGAPANKYFELGNFAGTETFYCRLTTQVNLEAVLEALENNDLAAA